MPWNGSGVFTRLHNWVSDATAGTKIRADRHDTEDDNFAAGISNAIARDGQSVVTANIPFNLKRIINLGDPVNDQDAMTKKWGQTNLISGAHVADTPPAAAQAGNLWWDSNDGNLYLKYSDGTSTQWVQVNIAPPVAPPDYPPSHVKLASGTISGSPTVFDVPLPTSGFTAFELYGTAINPVSGGAFASLQMQAWYGGIAGNSANNFWVQDSLLANGVAGAGWNATGAYNDTRMYPVPFVYPGEHYGIFHMRFPQVIAGSIFTFICDSESYGSGAWTRTRTGGGYNVAGVPEKLQFFFDSGVGFQNGGKWQLNGIR